METQRKLYTFLVMKMPMYTPDLHTKLSRIRIGQSLPEPVNENVIAQIGTALGPKSRIWFHAREDFLPQFWES